MGMKETLRELRDEKGAILVLFALLFVFLLGLVAMVVDAGLVYLNRAQLQRAADAAALAGAYQMPDTTAARDRVRQYCSLNGVKDADAVDVTFPNNRVRVEITRQVRLFFAPVLGIRTMEVWAGAAAATSRSRVFDFALFSGGKDQDLNFNGSSLYIDGSAHSNRNSKFHGSSITITGVMDTVGTFGRNGSSISIGAVQEYSEFLAMPDFSEKVRLNAEKIYDTDHLFGSSIDVDGDIVVNGSAHINGSTIRGNGTILTTDNIHINGSSIRYATAGDSVCLYSQNGDIHVNGSSIQIYGILYAPNGLIQINGSSITIYGSVVANEIKFNGSNIKVIYDPNATNILPGGEISLVE